MKYLKILMLLVFLNISASAAFLYDKDTPVCIDDFYQKSSRIYFLKSSNGKWSSTTENNTIKDIHPGFKYDSNTSKCLPDKWLIFGMSVTDYYFILALIGVLVGFVFMFFMVYIFIIVGGK